MTPIASRAPSDTEAFARNAARWMQLGTLKSPLTVKGMERYRVSLVTTGWAGVTDWLEEAGSDYRESTGEFSLDEAAYLHIADRANYFEHIWLGDSLVILTED